MTWDEYEEEMTERHPDLKMSPALERVIKETGDLIEKRSDLIAFMISEKFRALNTKSKRLLRKQQRIMWKYLRILDKRIDCWED